jgi:hypothetical protein
LASGISRLSITPNVALMIPAPISAISVSLLLMD